MRLSAEDEATVERVIDGLVALAGADGACGLLQFRSRAGAHQYRRLYRAVLGAAPRGGRVLDWGCGNGHFSYALLAMGYQASGFSFEDFALRDRLPAAYRFVLGRSDAPSVLPFADAEFDAVVSVGVLEHVRETGGTEQASLDEIVRVLRPGGCFVCYHFPNRTSAIEAAASLIPGCHHHAHRYVRRDIHDLCARAGLSVEATRRYGLLPRNLLHRLPGALRTSRLAAAGWDAADAACGALLAPLAQNHLFVARRPR